LVVLFGEDELAKGEVKVKELSTGTQTVVKREELIQYIQAYT